MTFAIGDVVEPIPGKFILACGSGMYDCAVVVSTDPFVLVSEEADMRWSCTVTPENFVKIGTADKKTHKRCVARWQRDIDLQNRELTKSLFRRAYDTVANTSLAGFERATNILKNRKG